jgi:hypothetical protein
MPPRKRSFRCLAFFGQLDYVHTFFCSLGRVRTLVTIETSVLKGARCNAMGTKRRKITSTRKQKGATKPPPAKDESGPAKSQKDDEGWGPVGAAAKKAAKGAVKGAAKEILK